MPPQAEFYTVAAGTNVLPTTAASQLLQTEYARVYNLRFDDIANHSGPIEVYWNGDLLTTVAASADGTFSQMYAEGTGGIDALDIEPHDGVALPTLSGFDLSIVVDDDSADLAALLASAVPVPDEGDTQEDDDPEDDLRLI